jgi:hypothetical protein
METADQPLDLVRLSLAEKIFVKMRGDRTLEGVLHVFEYSLGIRSTYEYGARRLHRNHNNGRGWRNWNRK